MNIRYTPEFKAKAISLYVEEKCSCSEVADMIEDCIDGTLKEMGCGE